jgi:hypothetical protein
MSAQNGKEPLQGTWCERHEKMIRDIHLAVCGNKDLGVDGLVEDVRKLKSWRRNQDLRVATISGCVAGALFVIKNFFIK